MKRQIIEQIRVLMKEYDISLSDIALGSADQTSKHFPFDLLCKIGDKYSRLPFDRGRNYNPIAIFPSLDSHLALSLTETADEVYRNNLDESNIPTYSFWREIFYKRNALNKALRELGAPIVDGCYFAEPMIGSRPNHIVAFNPDDRTLAEDYYNKNEKAKVRYSIFFTIKPMNGIVL